MTIEANVFDINIVLRAALGVMVLFLLVIISYKDIKSMEIPDMLNLALLVLGVVALLIVPEVALTERIIGLVVVAAPLLLITLLRRNAFGGGDIKLMAAAGFLLGWPGALLAAALGIILGSAYALYLVVRKQAKRDEKFPFGPFLCSGIAIAYFFQQPLLQLIFH